MVSVKIDDHIENFFNFDCVNVIMLTAGSYEAISTRCFLKTFYVDVCMSLLRFLDLLNKKFIDTYQIHTHKKFIDV